MHARTYTQINVQHVLLGLEFTRLYMYTYMHTYIQFTRLYMYTCIHTHMHTYIQISVQQSLVGLEFNGLRPAGGLRLIMPQGILPAPRLSCIGRPCVTGDILAVIPSLISEAKGACMCMHACMYV